jgi:hypothetical protein
MDPFKPYEPKPKTVALKLTASDAEVIALRVVAWIVADDEIRDRFTGLTGCGIDDLRGHLEQPGFLGSIVDFVLANEADVITFAEHAGVPPETLLLARENLP